MKPNEFINIIKHSIESGQIDEKLLSHEARFFRGRYLLKSMENISRLLKLFDFQDKIILEMINGRGLFFSNRKNGLI